MTLCSFSNSGVGCCWFFWPYCQMIFDYLFKFFLRYFRKISKKIFFMQWFSKFAYFHSPMLIFLHSDDLFQPNKIRRRGGVRLHHVWAFSLFFLLRIHESSVTDFGFKINSLDILIQIKNFIERKIDTIFRDLMLKFSKFEVFVKSKVLSSTN